VNSCPIANNTHREQYGGNRAMIPYQMLPRCPMKWPAETITGFHRHSTTTTINQANLPCTAFITTALVLKDVWTTQTCIMGILHSLMITLFTMPYLA
jgi:hypothetical protein